MELAVADVRFLVVLITALAAHDGRIIIAAAIAERTWVEVRTMEPRPKRCIPVFDHAAFFTCHFFIKRRIASIPFIVMNVCGFVF